jgi:glycosyltransferase involved in cell wall biosynthesis
MNKSLPSIHVLGSHQFGGADQFFVRLTRALHEAGQPVTTVSRANSPVSRAIANDGMDKIQLPLANGWDVWSIWRLRGLIKSRQPCIVQTYMGRATRLTRLPKKSQAVHVARLGGYYKIDGYYRHAHAWVGNTKGLCDYLIKSGLPANRVFEISNFVPEPIATSKENILALKRNWTIPEDAWVLFTLGRLIDIKGFEDLLESLARLPKEIQGRPIILLIAGTGPLDAKLKAQSLQLGLEDRVRWLGWQDPPDAFYALADVFVCPSRKETLGNVILEAWNHYLPVVSTQTPGPLELIDEGRTGFLTPIRDIQGMAARLQEMLTATTEQRARLGNEGHAYLNAHFGKAAIVNAYLGLYDQLLTEATA